jgi:hypothetical protein
MMTTIDAVAAGVGAMKTLIATVVVWVVAHPPLFFGRLACCCRPIIFRTVQGYFWRA